MTNPFDGLSVGEGGPPFYNFSNVPAEGKLFRLKSPWQPGKKHPSLDPHSDSRSEYAIVEALALDLAAGEEVLLPVSSKRLAVAIGGSGAGEGDLVRIYGHGEGMDRTYEVEVVADEEGDSDA